MGSANQKVSEKEGRHPGCNDANSDEGSNAKCSTGCSGDKDKTVEKGKAELGEAQSQYLHHEEDVFDLEQCGN